MQNTQSTWFDAIFNETTSVIKISNMNYEGAVNQTKKRVVIKLSEDMFADPKNMRFRKTFIWSLIQGTKNIMWVIVTDSIQNMAASLPKNWSTEFSNVCILALCKNNSDVDRALEHIPAGKESLFGLYMEDMQEEIILAGKDIESKLSVVIVGNDLMGECKPNHPDWVEKICDDCTGKVHMYYEGCGKYSIHKIIDDGNTVPPVTTQIKEKLSDMMVWARGTWHDTLPKERIKVRKLLASGSILAVLGDAPDFSGVVQGTVRKELPAAML